MVSLKISLAAQAENYDFPKVTDPSNVRLKNMISLNHEDLSVSGKGVLVAVVDSGVNFTTPGLQKNLVQGWNFITDDRTMVDYNNHGTPVAGIINVVAPSASLLPLVVISNVGDRKDVVSAVVYAIKNNVPVINISMTFDESMLREVRQTVGEKNFKKSLLVISSGNTGMRHDPLQESWDNVIIVGTVGLNTPVRSTKYSVYGPEVDIAAPSGDVGDGITTYSAFSSSLIPFNGTSGAAPVVSGAAALLKEKHPQATAAHLKTLILATACHNDNINVFKNRLLSVGRLLGAPSVCP